MDQTGGHCFVSPSKWSDRKDQNGDNMPLCIIHGEYSNGRAPIMICSYRRYGVKKAFLWTYMCMDEQKDERTTETIIFDQGVRNYIIVNDYDL